MQVGNVASLNIEVASPMETAYELARKMSLNKVGFLPVVEGGQLKGVVTDRDLVIRCLAEHLDPLHTDAFDLMSKPAWSVYSDAELGDAARLMIERNVRRLVVVDRKDAVVGVLSLDDIARLTSGDSITDKVLREVAYRVPAGVTAKTAQFDIEE